MRLPWWLIFALWASAAVGSDATVASDPAVVERPQYKLGDAWTYRRTQLLMLDHSRPKEVRFTDTVTAIAADGIEIRSGRVGGPPMRPRLYTPELNLVEEGAFRYKPAIEFRKFPLSAGKSWRSRYDFVTPAGYRTHSQLSASIEGWETVTVPAGTFRCLKIVVTTHGTAMGTVGTFGTDSLRTECWAPEVRWFVRMEFYLRWAANPTIHDLWELVAFKPAE